jgi:hypothetical protein
LNPQGGGKPPHSKMFSPVAALAVRLTFAWNWLPTIVDAQVWDFLFSAFSVPISFAIARSRARLVAAAKVLGHAFVVEPNAKGFG